MLQYRAPPSTDQSGCKLMDGFGIFIQLCLATTAFSTLIFKRQREQPQRPIRIWALDVSKQLAGGIMIHSLNVVAAVFFGVKPEQEGEKSNPCVWYFLNILVDTTLGIGILWVILRGFKYLVKRFELTGFQSGVYGDPPLIEQLKKWAKQLVVYIISLALMKVIVVGLFHLCPWISDFGDWVLEWTVGNYRLQVVFVMLIFPLVMNIMQFWVIDTFIKHKTTETSTTSIRLNRDEEDAERLLQEVEEGSHSNEPLEPPPRYSIADDDDDEDEEEESYVSIHHPSDFLASSSNNDTTTTRATDEYELKSSSSIVQQKKN